MNVIEYKSLFNCYISLTNILLKHLHCGDEDEVNHMKKLTLGEIAQFLDNTSVTVCDTCHGKGIVTDDFGVKECPVCKGTGGHFNETEIDFTL